MTTGTTRFVIIVGLVAAGFVVLASGFSGGAGERATGRSPSASENSPSTSPSHSKSPKPPVQPEKPKDITFVVLNGTTAAGLAGQWQMKLQDAGFHTAHVADNAPSQDVQKTVVYFGGGDQAEQNKADASLIARRYFPDAAVRGLSPDYADSALVGDAKVVIVIGADAASTS